MNITRATCYLIQTTDKPGEAANLLGTLKANNVDLDAIWGYGKPDGRADVYIVPKNPSTFTAAAAKLGITASEGACFRVSGADEPGVLTSTFSSIARQEINISAFNATAVDGKVGGYIWCKPADADRIAKALNI